MRKKKPIKVGIVAPSSHVEKPSIQNGLDYLESLGMEYRLSKHIFDCHLNTAGTPENRAEDIMDMFKDPEIKMIFCARGGVGSQCVLDHLDYDIIKKNKKPIIGFSDATALQLGIYRKTKNPAYTGFDLKSDFEKGTINKKITTSFNQIIKKERFRVKCAKTVISGSTKGKLIGGCLSLIRNLCGTPYFPDLKNGILLLEDVDEYTYKIALMLQQIKHNPQFNKVKGIVFGQFIRCKERHAGDGTIDEIIDNFCKDLDIPVIKNFPYAHNKRRYVLPIGAKVKLDAEKGSLEILKY